MKFKILLLIFFISKSASAQYWEPLGGGVKSDLPGIVSISPVEFAVDTFHNYLWVAAPFDTAGGMEAHNIAIWTGTQWKRLSEEPEPPGAIVMKRDTLIFAEGFSTDHHIHLYVDTVNVGSLGDLGNVICLYVFKDTIYAGGEFNYGIKYWNGSAWKKVGGGVSGPEIQVQAIGSYNGQLIAAGHFDLAGSVAVNNIASWDGSQWHKLGTGITGPDFPIVYSLQEFSGELYVGGSFDSAGEINAPDFAKWNGTTWDTVATYAGQYACGIVYGLFAKDDKLYACGLIDGDDGCMGWGAGQFDGTAWHDLSVTHSGYTWSITVFDGDIIIGTDFAHTSTSDTINYIGKFIGSIPTGIADEGKSLIFIFPNPASSTIQIHLPSNQPTTLAIFNLLGEKVREEKISGKEISIDVSDLPSGMYVARTEKEVIGKFVKE